MSKKHEHYFKPVGNLTEIDVYAVLKLFQVEDHAIGHAVKKLLCAGKRGAKDRIKDFGEAIDSINRAVELEQATSITKMESRVSLPWELDITPDTFKVQQAEVDPISARLEQEREERIVADSAMASTLTSLSEAIRTVHHRIDSLPVDMFKTSRPKNVMSESTKRELSASKARKRAAKAR